MAPSQIFLKCNFLSENFSNSYTPPATLCLRRFAKMAFILNSINGIGGLQGGNNQLFAAGYLAGLEQAAADRLLRSVTQTPLATSPVQQGQQQFTALLALAGQLLTSLLTNGGLPNLNDPVQNQTPPVGTTTPVSSSSETTPMPPSNNGPGVESGDLQSPLAKGKYSVSQEEKPGAHPGIDLAAAGGTPIMAAGSGKVIKADPNSDGSGYGNYVVIDHGNGLQTLYGHMQSAPAVRVGDTVQKGQEIGVVGSTGQSTGNHLHFEVNKNGQHQNPRDFAKDIG